MHAASVIPVESVVATHVAVPPLLAWHLKVTSEPSPESAATCRGSVVPRQRIPMQKASFILVRLPGVLSKKYEHTSHSESE